MKRILMTAAIGLTLWGSAAAAEPPACRGAYEIVRTSTIKPGKMQIFLKAVHDHQAWYLSHGLKDHILLGRVLARDADASGFSASTAMTVHTDLSQMAPPAQSANDAAWNAYVAEYRDSSDLVSTVIVCLEPAPR